MSILEIVDKLGQQTTQIENINAVLGGALSYFDKPIMLGTDEALYFVHSAGHINRLLDTVQYLLICAVLPNLEAIYVELAKRYEDEMVRERAA